MPNVSFNAVAVSWSKHWTELKAFVDGKQLPIQYDDDGDIYTIYAVDGVIVYQTVIWQGAVPDSLIASGYSQAQNDADKADFVTNYLPTANGVSAIVTALPATNGTEANAWAAAVVGAGGTSTAVDCQYTPLVSCFGNTSAVTTITVQVSQDNAAWYDAFSTHVAPAGDFYLAGTIGARYVRLLSSAAATITATIAGKS